MSANTTKQLTFFRNWYELAEEQTDDLKRLAYYDAIMRYAFDGEVPERPSRRESGVKRASYFAFLTVQPVIDSAKNKNNAAKKAAETRWKKDALHNAPHDAEENAPHNAPHDAANDAEEDAPHNAPHDTSLEKNRIEENRKEASSRAGAREPPNEKQFLEGCCLAGIPADFAAALFAEISTNGWADRDGRKIGNWRMYAKRIWNEHRNAPPPIPPQTDIHRVTEADL